MKKREKNKNIGFYGGIKLKLEMCSLWKLWKIRVDASFK